MNVSKFQTWEDALQSIVTVALDKIYSIRSKTSLC
jgi:hypothetical protein